MLLLVIAAENVSSVSRLAVTDALGPAGESGEQLAGSIAVASNENIRVSLDGVGERVGVESDSAVAVSPAVSVSGTCVNVAVAGISTSVGIMLGVSVATGSETGVSVGGIPVGVGSIAGSTATVSGVPASTDCAVIGNGIGTTSATIALTSKVRLTRHRHRCIPILNFAAPPSRCC